MLRISCILLLCSSCLHAALGPNISLVKNGIAVCYIRADSTVMISTDKSHQRLRESIHDLASCLQKISGASISILTDPRPESEKGFPLLVGDCAAKKFGVPAAHSHYGQAWRLVVSKKGIGCIGESEESVSYAIYELLDRLGCRWYMPGDIGEVIPAMKTITMKELDISDTPQTICRKIWYADEAFMRRSRLGGPSLTTGQILERYIPSQALKDHPDWNAEIGGKRSINGRLCWACDGVVNAIADTLISRIGRTHQMSVSLSPVDGITFCECPKCKALDAGDWDSTMNCVSITDRYVNFCNRIIDRVARVYPEELFGMLAYVQYTRPPVRETPDPRLVPVLAPITYCRAHSMADTACASRQDLLKLVHGWSRRAGMLGFYEYGYHLAEVSAPDPMIAKWSGDLPILYRNKMKFWLPETMANFESVLPGLYLGIRLSWYPTADPGKILDEFYERFYGRASGPMATWWGIIDSAWSAVPEHAGNVFGYARRFAPEMMKRARTALDSATAACATAMEYRRVKLADDSFREFELLMKMRRNLFDGHWNTLEADAQNWEFRWSMLNDEYKGNYCFSPFGVRYFDEFQKATLKDAARISVGFRTAGKPLVSWKYLVDKEKAGDSLKVYSVDYGDRAWPSTNPCIDTWSDLGIGDYFGTVWYRAHVKLPAITAGKKIFLWISSEDGSLSVYLNGQHVPFARETGDTLTAFSGYCKPVSFDITARAKPAGDNVIAIRATRTQLNELGGGGLLGPVAIYAEK